MFTRLLNPFAALLVCLLACLLANTADAASAADRPANVIVILVDDLGQSDLSCYGSRFYETPHIDQLAKEGVRFANGYSACTVCSPTRAALLTGKYPARLHITDWITGHDRPNAKLKIPDWQKFLPFEEVTLAEQFKAAGYATASIGKWHLTPALKQGDEAYYPEQHGFDVNIGGYARGQPPSYFAPFQIPTLTEGPAGEFLTDREANEAVKFITAHQDKPFFLYLPHYAVHTPIGGKPAVIAKYKDKAARLPDLKQKNATYAALVESVDDALGTIRVALEDLKLAEHTIIVFTSDNGGLILRNGMATDNSPFRAGKGSAYEGGVRVPLIIHAPGTTKPGLVEATPAITVDLYPTLLELTGIKPLESLVDGISLAPLLKQAAKPDRQAIFWHYPHYHPGGATPYSAIRSGDFRLVHFYEDGRNELYDLAQDVGETKDLAAAQPERVKAMHTRLDAWLESVDAQLPTANPAHDAAADAGQGRPKAQKAVQKAAEKAARD
jgi:arylsulfatase A-like enzyme